MEFVQSATFNGSAITIATNRFSLKYQARLREPFCAAAFSSLANSDSQMERCTWLFLEYAIALDHLADSKFGELRGAICVSISYPLDIETPISCLQLDSLMLMII
uniref:Uncharacterized protein n=1 Tax=Coccidioides posadasii RMSCC 3488 TaxID=454284 RepID=A0A0J6FIE6_COCPO|nr:hypothetical protein CPAG_09261 [Coccidioides posadasii RMSCC 3488]